MGQVLPALVSWPVPNIGHNSHKSILFCNGDQWLHCLPELHHTLHHMAQFTKNQLLDLLCPVVEHPHVGKGLAWLGELAVLAAKPQVEGCSHYPHHLPSNMPLTPQMRNAPFGQIASSNHCWGPPAVLSTRLAFLLGKCTTVSNSTGTRERALDHWVPCHQLEMTPPHPGVPGGGASAGGPLKSSSSLPASGLDKSTPMWGTLPAFQVGGGNQWASSILTSLSRLPLDDEGAFLLAKLTCHYCLEGLENWAHPQTVPLQWEVTWGLSTVTLHSLWWEVTWRSSLWHPKDLDLPCQWPPEHQQILELQWLPEHHQLMEQLIHAIFSSSFATATRACQWTSLTRAIILLYKSCFAAVNFMYVWQLAAANSIRGSGQGTSASDCLHFPSGCVDSHLSQRHSLMESRISLQRWSLVASLHQPFPGSLQSWNTSWYRSSISSWMWLGQTSSMAVGSVPRSHLGDGSLWSWWIAWLCSPQPVAGAWRNICWHRYLQWGQLGAHCHCSSR